MELKLQSLYQEKKSTTLGLLLPVLTVSADGSYFGDLFDPLDATGEINGALLWKIPVGRLTYGGKLKQYNARIALQKTQLNQAMALVNEQVISAREQILTSKEQTEVALEGSQLGEQALKQSIERQQLGTVRPFEILQAMEIYIKSRLDHLKAASTYNKAQYKLFVAMGNDL